MLNLVWLIPGFPVLAVLINALFGKRYLKTNTHYFAVGSIGLSFLVSCYIFYQVAFNHVIAELVLYEWIMAGDLSINFGFLIDPLSAIMLMVVTGVGFLIHVYSVGYMHGDTGYHRYFTYLNLFMVSMLILVLGNNYLLLFVGWEGVGLCSYLLIGYFFHKKSATDAGIKAFLVNRIGDAGVLLAMFLMIVYFKTLNFTYIFNHTSLITPETATAITLLLLLGVCGKSAQVPLFIWLPDAMEGPTPVSALIHAATMVTAGVYMIARSNALYLMSPTSMTIVATVGAVTALFAATIGLAQNDIKRVLAYSTVSQLGYMVMACGVGAFVAGIFHLMTHAFFKALLFMGSGSVIHALSGEQEMRKMGALRPHMPRTFWTFLAATLAISGIPMFSGFFSKDEILWKAFSSEHGHWAFWLVGAVAAGMTAFYMFRLVFMTFFGKSRVDREVAKHLHESPSMMTVPLIILGILSIIGGYVGIPAALGGSNWIHHFLAPVMAGGGGGHAEIVQGVAIASEVVTTHGAAAATGGAHHDVMEYVLMAVSVGIVLFGIFLAHLFYIKNPSIPEKLAKRFSGLHKLIYNKYYIDEIYDFLIVKRAKQLATLCWKAFDVPVIDGIVNGVARLTVLESKFSGVFDLSTVDGAVNGIGTIVKSGAKSFKRFQTGFVQNYAFVMLLGVFVMVTLYLFF